uniref:hypothetical protein n=1 Tax=Streptomyces sp. TP-A0356 TaxID=1359208 RepID=UPI000A9BF756
ANSGQSEGAGTPPHGSTPFAITLTDGQSCSFVGGATLVVADKRLSYSCSKGALFGNPDRTVPAWTISYLPSGSSALRPAVITSVVQ